MSSAEIIRHILPFVPAAILLAVFWRLDRLLRLVRPHAKEPLVGEVIRGSRIALWGSWLAVLATAVVLSVMGKG